MKAHAALRAIAADRRRTRPARDEITYRPLKVLLYPFVPHAGCSAEGDADMEVSSTRRLVIAGLGTMGAPTASGAPRASTAFAAFSKRALFELFRLSPSLATFAGEHRYDDRLDDVSPAGRTSRLLAQRALLAALENIDRRALSRADQIDAAILQNTLQSSLWTDAELKSWAWDPTMYNDMAGQSLYLVMAREYAPTPVRLRRVSGRLRALPTFLSQARAALRPELTPPAHAEIVVAQNAGLLRIIDGEILPLSARLSRAHRDDLAAAAAVAKAAITKHQAWLEGVLAPGARGDFRIGATLFDAKLKYDLGSDLSRAEIRRRAEAEMARITAEMYSLTRQTLRGRPDAPALPEKPSLAEQRAAILGALRLASEAHAARDKLFDAAEQALADATAFVRARGLVTLPGAPPKMVAMPEFQRGVIPFYCEQPGPLDRSLDTYVGVSPIPSTWSDAQAESFLREYSDRGLREIVVHEAMPGHYVQLAHSNQYPSVLRGTFYSGAFVEGWAVYAQDVMADEGYLDHDPLYRLVHLKFQLRTVANAILDQAVHVDGMSRDDAMRFLIEEAFQEEREAAGKWTRAQLSAVQLSTYFVGWQDHWRLRRDVERRQGGGFDLRTYHDQVLSFGAPPVRHVRQLMLGEAIT